MGKPYRTLYPLKKLILKSLGYSLFGDHVFKSQPFPCCMTHHPFPSCRAVSCYDHYHITLWDNRSTGQL